MKTITKIGIVLLSVGLFMSLVIFFWLMLGNRMAIAASIAVMLLFFGVVALAIGQSEYDEEGGEE